MTGVMKQELTEILLCLSHLLLLTLCYICTILLKSILLHLSQLCYICHNSLTSVANVTPVRGAPVNAGPVRSFSVTVFRTIQPLSPLCRHVGLQNSMNSFCARFYIQLAAITRVTTNVMWLLSDGLSCCKRETATIATVYSEMNGLSYCKSKEKFLLYLLSLFLL